MVEYLPLFALVPGTALGVLWEREWRKADTRKEYQLTCPHYWEDVTPKWADQSKRSLRCTDPQCGKEKVVARD